METVLISLITAAWWYLLGLSISLYSRTGFLVYFFSFLSWNKSSASYPYLGDSAHLFGLWTWVLLCHMLFFRRKAVLQQSVRALPPHFLSNLYGSSPSTRHLGTYGGKYRGTSGTEVVSLNPTNMSISKFVSITSAMLWKKNWVQAACCVVSRILLSLRWEARQGQ